MADAALRIERRSPTATRRPPATRSGDRPAGGARRVRGDRGPLRLRQVDALARRLRPGPALPRRAGRGRARGGRNGRELPRPCGARRGGRAGRPGAGDAGGEHDRAGRDRAAARAPRRLAGRRDRAPSRRCRWRWRSTGCWSGPRTRSPAASCSGSRWRRRSPPGRAWCCSTSRPRSSTRWRATS